MFFERDSFYYNALQESVSLQLILVTKNC